MCYLWRIHHSAQLFNTFAICLLTHYHVQWKVPPPDKHLRMTRFQMPGIQIR